MNNLDNQRIATMQSINRLIDKSKNLSRAFTIIELLVVIGIIAILMGVLIGTFSGSSESARAAKCQANMHNLAMAVQAYGVANSHYPSAGPVKNDEVDSGSGWLSADNNNNPYLTGAEARRNCIESGTLWKYMKGDRSSYVCPSHQRYAKERKLGDPLWSYAMSSYFNVGSGREYGKLRRADRYLLFAEVPYAKASVGATVIQDEGSGSALDSVIASGSEVIGFNHKDGKNLSGHVCFADGHVEKLRAPNDKGNIKNLTEWLCRPFEVDQQGNRFDFDIRFRNGKYEKDDESASN